MNFLVNPLHYALHHDLGWTLAARFPFAAVQITLPVARAEMRGLAEHAPLLLQRAGANLVPVVVLNPAWCRTPVFDAHLNWAGPYPPLVLRYHPFQLIDDAARPGQYLLGVANDPETVSREQPNAFFDERAQPAPLVRAVFRRLQIIRHERARIVAAAMALEQAGLVRSLSLKDARGRKLFHSLDAAKFKVMGGADLAGLGERPQDAQMLAVALEYSQSRHLLGEDPDPIGQKTILASSPFARGMRPAASPSFLVDDDYITAFGS